MPVGGPQQEIRAAIQERKDAPKPPEQRLESLAHKFSDLTESIRKRGDVVDPSETTVADSKSLESLAEKSGVSLSDAACTDSETGEATAAVQERNQRVAELLQDLEAIEKLVGEYKEIQQEVGQKNEGVADGEIEDASTMRGQGGASFDNLALQDFLAHWKAAKQESSREDRSENSKNKERAEEGAVEVNIDELTQELQIQKDYLHECKTSVDDLSKDLEKNTTDISEHEQLQNTNSAEILQTQQAFQYKNTEIARKQEQRANILGSIDTVSNHRASLEKRFNAVSSKEEKNLLQDQINELNTQEQTLKGNLGECEQQIETMKSNLDTLTGKLEELQEYESEIVDELARLASKQQEIKLELEKAEKEVVQQEQVVAAVEDVLNQVHERAKAGGSSRVTIQEKDGSSWIRIDKL